MACTLFVLSSFIFPSCSQGGGNIGSDDSGPVIVEDTYTVKDVSFSMAKVSAGTVALGTTRDGRFVTGCQVPMQVVMDPFAIMEEPVSQALWTAVMGSNPASALSPSLPVDRVSKKDCEKFASKLSKLTGVPFILPTEAMWEYAVKSGSVKVEAKLKEWCSDVFAENFPAHAAYDPTGEGKGALCVVRSSATRESLSPSAKSGGLTFRLAVRPGDKAPEQLVGIFLRGEFPPREHSCTTETVEVLGERIAMTAVRGGKFFMGATSEQGQYASDNEKPSHEVVVEDFEMQTDEVTAGLFLKVMGFLPFGNSEKNLDAPVVNVSWYGAQDFIYKLNSLTGRTFRLPTEQEWEYAARGGEKSRGYRYSGANLVGTVAVYADNQPDHRVTKIRTKKPNELGLYDMSGNAWEWCIDSYTDYGNGMVADPDVKVMRGGSAASPWGACRVSNRASNHVYGVKATYGFRLAI